ncbi:MAG: hypothetical protein RLZZ342_441 [Candidatus Parcubacteria bacterium]|jgi:ribulose-phosphate 3-epimerase
MIEILPTVVPKSARAVETFAARWDGIASVLHIDATDGDFAFPTTWIPVPGDLLPVRPVWEAHVMARNPRAVGERFIRAGAWRIIGHAEALEGEEGEETLQGWRAMGAREVGISLLLNTPLVEAAHLAPHADVVHLMTIRKIGAQGQEFVRDALERIAEAKRLFPRAVISVDGGINEKTIADVVRAGATRMCVGAALASTPDAQESYTHLKSLAESALQ